MSGLQVTWFVLITVLLVGYTILDGFDLGVGFWHLFTRNAKDRRTLVNAIGPFWDGNEVWLVTAAGALFAAFPAVYATVFSSFYLPLMAVLFALILRAVAIEFGSKEIESRARHWDFAFAGGSMLAVLLFGLAFGNILRGLPLTAEGNFAGSLLTLLNPFALLVVALNLVMLALHGALYIVVRTEGDLATDAHRWARSAWMLYLPLAAVTLGYAAFTMPHLIRNYIAQPALWLIPALAVVGIIFSGVWNARNKPVHAFVASSFSIAALLASAAIGLFPLMVSFPRRPRMESYPGQRLLFFVNAENHARPCSHWHAVGAGLYLVGVPDIRRESGG